MTKQSIEKAKSELSFFNEGDYITREMSECKEILEEYIEQLENKLGKVAEFIKKDIDNINNRINLIIQRTREEEICDEDMMIIIALQSQLKEKEKLLKIIKGKNDKESKWYYDKPSKTIRVFRKYICRNNRFIHEVQKQKYREKQRRIKFKNKATQKGINWF